MGKNAIVRKIVPWSHESQYFLSNQSFSVHLHVPKAPIDSEYDSVHLQFIKPNPKCTFQIEYELVILIIIIILYIHNIFMHVLCVLIFNLVFCYYNCIRISTHWIGMCAQLARFYSPFILPMLFAIFLHCFSRQLKEKQARNAVPSILSCLLDMPVIKMALIPEAFSISLGYCLFNIMACKFEKFSVQLMRVLSSRIIDSLHLSASSPFLLSDEFLLRNHGLGFPFMYFFLGFIAWSSAIILSVIFCLGISLGGNILHTLIIR